jgi:SAM-dependent methyltransferase
MGMDGKIRNRGIQSVLTFYEKKLHWKVQQFNHKFPLNIYFDDMIGNKKEVYLADLGAGMFATTGILWYSCEIRLYPSDILADEYKKILKRHSITPLYPVEKQDMENLTYKDEFFDIVHCVNALDHCKNPLKALKEMYRICKKGGWIYLRHGLNMGETRRYSGLHQWNIKITKNNDCLFWSKNNKFLLSEVAPFKNEMKKEIGNEPEMVVSTYYKL